jgi:hypothetical protein
VSSWRAERYGGAPNAASRVATMVVMVDDGIGVACANRNFADLETARSRLQFEDWLLHDAGVPRAPETHAITLRCIFSSMAPHETIHPAPSTRASTAEAPSRPPLSNRQQRAHGVDVALHLCRTTWILIALFVVVVGWHGFHLQGPHCQAYRASQCRRVAPLPLPRDANARQPPGGQNTSDPGETFIQALSAGDHCTPSASAPRLNPVILVSSYVWV